MQAGFGKARLDPPDVELPLAGFVRMWDGKLDDLHVRAMVVSDGEHIGAIVSADVLGFFRKTVLAARQLASQGCPVPAENILLCGTHTHSAPGLIVIAPEHMDARWFDEFYRCVAEAVRGAYKSLEPATFSWARGEVDVCVNRRETNEKGICLGQNFSGPRDTGLQLVSATSSSGRELGCVVNYACHPVILGSDNRQISADYPGMVCRALEEDSGGTCLFLTGTCGDINPSLDGQKWVRKSYDELTTFAGRISGRCLDLKRAAMTPLGASGVEVSSHSLDLELAPDPPARAEGLKLAEEPRPFNEKLVRNALRADLGDERRADEHIVAFRDEYRKRKLRIQSFLDERYGIQLGAQNSVSTEIQCVRVGDWRTVGLPGEVLVGIGTSIKEPAPKGPCMVATCANDYLGYLPEPETYVEGAFESWHCILSERGVRTFNEQTLEFAKECAGG